MACDRRRRITRVEIADYLHRRALRFSQKLKKQSAYEKFVWLKKIERDLLRPDVKWDDYFSLEAEMKRQENRESEIEAVRRRRDERKRIFNRSDEKIYAHHDSPSPSPSPSDSDQSVEDYEQQSQVDRGDFSAEAAIGDEDRSEEEKDGKPKFVYRVQTGYEWNKYNRTHYDHDNPPPKFVQGYKFDVLYPLLVDRSKTPTYTVLRDGDSVDTCIIRFHGGPPYDDLAFRIVNGGDWDYSRKNGFKCTFEGGVLRLYFNFQRIRYRR